MELPDTTSGKSGCAFAAFVLGIVVVLTVCAFAAGYRS